MSCLADIRVRVLKPVAGEATSGPVPDGTGKRAGLTESRFLPHGSCGRLLVVTDADTDPVAAFRTRLQDLFVQVRRPSYRSLETHADQDGRALRRSTVSDLLNGPGTPRWD